MNFQKLQDYVNNFDDRLQETVMETILSSIAMREVFESKEGGAILNGVFETMTNNVMKIVKIASAGAFTEKVEDARLAAEEIAFLHRQLINWASVLQKGAEHLDNARR